jgi:hypothetical protein
MSKPIIAYSLWPNLDFLNLLAEDPMDREYGEAEKYNAWVYKPTEPKGIPWGGTSGTIPYSGPEPIDFVGFLDERLHQTDYLYTDDSDLQPIISKRMLYVLRSVGEFPHKVISTRIYDYGFQDQGRYKQDQGRYEVLGREAPLLAGEFNEDYVSLQLLEHVDGIDNDHSEFDLNPDPDNLLPDLVLPPDIINLVLKEPIGGFPPIFRLNRTGERRSLYVSPATKEALEEAGIRGLGFTEYEGTRAEEMSVSN